MSNSSTADEHDDDHVKELADGAGCTEIWEHLSERRNGDSDQESSEESELQRRNDSS